MKKLAMLALAVILVPGMIFSAPAPKAQGNAWQKLDAVNIIPHVRTYAGKTIKVKKRYENINVVELAPIRRALEEAGIDEQVSIELRYNHKLVAKLGTYTPTVTIKEGKQAFSFASMPQGLGVYGNLSILSPDYYDNTSTSTPQAARFNPYHMKLYFKNAENKTKAKVCVSFL